MLHRILQYRETFFSNNTAICYFLVESNKGNTQQAMVTNGGHFPQLQRRAYTTCRETGWKSHIQDAIKQTCRFYRTTLITIGIIWENRQMRQGNRETPDESGVSL